MIGNGKASEKKAKENGQQEIIEADETLSQSPIWTTLVEKWEEMEFTKTYFWFHPINISTDQQTKQYVAIYSRVTKIMNTKYRLLRPLLAVAKDRSCLLKYFEQLLL